MTLEIYRVIKSIAAQLAGAFPYYPVYASPNQQGTKYPCFFVFVVPTSGISDQLSERAKRDISLDVVFVQERNKAGANEELYAIAETLDELLDTVAYTADGETVPLHTHDRTYSIEDLELHYKLRVSQRVYVPRQEIPMQVLEENNVEIKD